MSVSCVARVLCVEVAHSSIPSPVQGVNGKFVSLSSSSSSSRKQSYHLSFLLTYFHMARTSNRTKNKTRCFHILHIDLMLPRISSITELWQKKNEVDRIWGFEHLCNNFSSRSNPMVNMNT